MKKTIIFGDSYSTFQGFIPEGYEIYYSPEGHPESGVGEVGKTWWHRVCEAAELELVLNNSWSGSTIGYTGYSNSDTSKTSSFIHRLRELSEGGFFEENPVDTVFVFGGTNDDWSGAPLGEEKYSDFCEEDLFFVLPGIADFLFEVKNTFPHADIYCLINTELKGEITHCLEKSCVEYGITPVHFDAIEKINGHPTALGMEQIAQAVLCALGR